MDRAFLSFGEQALRYFQRPHEAIARAPLAGPAAWRGGDVATRTDWRVTLADADVAELEAAADAAAGRTLGDVGREEFPLPTLAPRIAGWARELLHGRGFLVVRGLPVARWGDERSALVYWGLGQHLGRPGAQNAAGELLGHVTATGEDAANPFVRRYRTAGDIAWHCDLADAVGLLCLRAAARGGASRIASSVTVYNELLRRRPDLVDRLYQPFALDRRDEATGRGPAWVPAIPCRHAGGALRTFWHSDYFRSAVRHPDVALGELERSLLDAWEAIADEPDLHLDMQLEPGDVQLLSNHVVVHARTAYADDPGAGRGRHLLRLWLTLGAD